MIAVVDSGGANLASVIFAIERLGRPYIFTADPDVILKASHVILPGVGAASGAMATLAERGLVDCLRELTQPVLGICLGMQLLFDWSEEGDVALLKRIPGRIRKFESDVLTVPHMGWNTLQPRKSHVLLKGLSANPYVYFVHSYHAPLGDHTLAQTGYGVEFTSIVARDNVFGCQFHPERSGQNGARILQNFVEL